jgi:16S rRNA (guanine527-N7)-methyltransferase
MNPAAFVYETVVAAADKAGIPLYPELSERFAEYLAILLRWNAKLNLTALRQPEQIVQRHFAECIFAAGQIPKNTKTLLDFGSGAGFPGIPISICRPEISVTLAESQQKKAAFLKETVRGLRLKAEVFAGRVESMQDRLFDGVTLRAVDKMEAATRTAAAKVAPGGRIILFATRTTAEALQSGLPDLDWQTPVPVPGLEHGVLLTGIHPR